MITLKLDRDIRDRRVSLGNFYDETDSLRLYTIERPWLDNQVGISCIPTGIYYCERDMYYGGDGVGGKRDYPCFIVKDVPGRTEIKIHIANYVKDIIGCIGVGLTRNVNVPAVWGSRMAHDKFMIFMEGINEFKLEITDV